MKSLIFKKVSDMKNKKQLLALGLLSLSAIALVGCGGGSNKPPISKVYVMGDSLADVGTFGYKFTVQNANDPKGFLVWPQLVANAFGLDGSAQCNFYTSQSSSFGINSTAGCTNFAIGGSKVFVNASNGGANNPQTIGTQLAQKVARLGDYSSTDLVLIDGGGNDMVDLVTAQLSGTTAFQTFLAQQLDNTTITTLLTQDPTGASAAAAYMQTLATNFYAQIKAQTLDKGATHVGLLNMPDITLTPEVKSTLAQVQAQQGGVYAQALQAGIRTWTGVYNTKLKALTNGDRRVALIDFYAELTDEIANPSTYGLTNAQDMACPATGYSLSSLAYNYSVCTDAALDATAGKTAGWWKTYAFSDGFHPTPYGHQLLANSVSRGLSRAGWL
jgi:phospholipase/lecithinase/hemolysin